MEKLEIVYNTISHKENLENTRLSVVLSTDSLCFFIHVPTSEQSAIFYLKSKLITEKCNILERIVNEYKVKDTKLYYDNGRFSLVPRNLFLYGYEKDYVKNIFSNSKQDVLFNDQLTTIAAVNIYAYSLVDDLQIRQQFPGIKTKHLVSSLIETFSDLANGLVCFLSQDAAYFIEKKDGKLLGNVRYAYQTNEDILYYTSLFVDNHGLYNEIIFTGLISEEDELLELLKKYHSSVRLWNENIWLNCNPIFKESL